MAISMCLFNLSDQVDVYSRQMYSSLMTVNLDRVYMIGDGRYAACESILHFRFFIGCTAPTPESWKGESNFGSSGPYGSSNSVPNLSDGDNSPNRTSGGSWTTSSGNVETCDTNCMIYTCAIDRLKCCDICEDRFPLDCSEIRLNPGTDSRFSGCPSLSSGS